MRTRTLRVLQNQPDQPPNFPYAVSHLRSPQESEILAWFKTERDAKIFAEAEKKIADFELKLRNEEQRRLSDVSTAYRHALVLR